MGCNCGGRRRGPAKARRARTVTPGAENARKAAAARRAAAPPPKPPKPVRRPPKASGEHARAAAYTIVRGDTMAEIARTFGMTTKELVKYDGGTGTPNIMRLRSRNAHIIHPGETILVPRRKK